MSGPDTAKLIEERDALRERAGRVDAELVKLEAEVQATGEINRELRRQLSTLIPELERLQLAGNGVTKKSQRLIRLILETFNEVDRG